MTTYIIRIQAGFYFISQMGLVSPGEQITLTKRQHYYKKQFTFVYNKIWHWCTIGVPSFRRILRSFLVYLNLIDLWSPAHIPQKIWSLTASMGMTSNSTKMTESTKKSFILDFSLNGLLKINSKWSYLISECVHQLAESRGGPLCVQGLLPMLHRRRPDAIHPRTELCRIAQTQRAQLLQKRQNRVASNERSRKSGSSLFHRLLDFLVKTKCIEQSSSHLFCLKEHSKSITWHKYNISKTFVFMFEQKDNLSSSSCFK